MTKTTMRRNRVRFGLFTHKASALWRFGASPEAVSLMSAFRIAGVYLVFGALWIFFSDLIVDFLVQEPALKTAVSIVKGWAYVVITAVILAALVYRSLSKIVEYDRHFTKSCETLRDANSELLRYRNGLDSLVHERTVKLESATEEARSANRAKSHFIAHISHEIRTPLNAIVGLTHLMEKTKLDTKQAEYCSMMRNSSKILLGIINDVLDFSKIESGKLELNKATYSIRTLLSRIESILFPLVEGKGLSLEITVDPSIPDRLVGDELRLGQILLNLAMNAAKFTKRGFIKISIAPMSAQAITEASAEGDLRIRFAVTDSGIGISEAQMTRLFKAFSQADSSTTKEYGGTGLGLAISKALVEAMDGSIGVSSTVGVGTEFFFEVPQERAPDENADSPVGAEGEGSSEGAREGSAKGAPLPGASVLIVDDNEINLMILEECLRDSGLAIRAAQGGPEALELALADSGGFDVILLDLHMPELDGIAVARAIRAREDIAQPVIIALTADADSAVRDCVLGAGMNDFITKPIDHDHLLTCLSYWLARVAGTSGTSGEA